MKIYNPLYFTIAIVTVIFLYLYTLYYEQKNSYKDLYLDVCNKECTYFIPKELKPQIVSNQDNSKTINIEYSINNKKIPIWLNLRDYKFKYPKNHQEDEENLNYGIVKKSNFFDEIYKKYYFYFYDKYGIKVVFIDNSFVLEVDKKINDELMIKYMIPSDLISEIVKIDEQITANIKFFKVNKAHE